MTWINMVYYPDLNTNSSDGVFHIGWLDRERPFSQGVVDLAFMEKLKLYYNRRVRQSSRSKAMSGLEPFCCKSIPDHVGMSSQPHRYFIRSISSNSLCSKPDTACLRYVLFPWYGLRTRLPRT
jgi:hypothetical protein